MKRMFYVISDSLGETAMQVLKASISQFDFDDYGIRRFSYVLEEEVLRNILENAVREDALVVHTLVETTLIGVLDEFHEKYNLRLLDVLGPSLDMISDIIHLPPKRVPGVIRKINDTYYKRVEAIEFAVKYDDGKDPSGVLKADLVLIGISRTSKTPLSMYLANKNIKVCNIPLVPEAVAPEQIFQVDPNKVVGLTNSPEKLMQIREERLKSLGLSSSNKYSDMTRIMDEINYATVIMSRIGCPVINVADKAIEETADIILNIMKTKGLNVYND